MNSQLKSIGEIFSETWELYRQRAIPILLVILLTSCIVVVLICVFGIIIALGIGGLNTSANHFEIGGYGPLLSITVLISMLIVLILIFWSQAATIAVTLDNDLSVMDACKAGWQYLIPMGWVGTLYMGIVLTGMTLLIIPGVILGLSMSLCCYALFDDDLRGMDALLTSQCYIKGHWWNTLGKFFLIGLASMAVNLVPVIGQLLSFIFTPFLLLYMVVVYRDLKEAAGEVDLHAGPRWLWALMAAVGIVLPLLGLVGALVTLGPQLPGYLQQLEEGKIPGWERSCPYNTEQSSIDAGQGTHILVQARRT